MNNYQLREGPEQEELRENFVGLKSDRALICQCCCTGSKVISRCWEGGFSRINGKKVSARRCNNCNYVQHWNERQRRCDKPTKSQERAIERIRRYFERDQITEFDVKTTNYGIVWVTVKTAGNVYQARGGFFKVPRNRGKVECSVSHDLFTKAKHYTKMVN